MTTAEFEPCLGNNCKHRKRCKLFDPQAKVTHGYLGEDGFECTEWEKTDKVVVETDDGDIGLF